MDKKQRELRRKQEDTALQHGLLWVVGAVILEGLLLLVDRFYINCSVHEVDLAYGIYNVLRVLRVAGPILALAGVVWALIRAKKAGRTAPAVIGAVAAGAVGICSHVAVRFQENGISMLYWLVVAWAVLAMVYYIYQREFFLAAAGVGMAILGLWFARYMGLGLESSLCLVGIAAVIAVTLWLKKRDGAGFLEKGAGYLVILVSCGAAIAAMAVGLALGGAVAYYLVYVMLAWMFALFVYYTVKLM